MALGHDAWQDRAAAWLTLIQDAPRFESSTWVRLSSVLLKLGFYGLELEKLLLTDLKTIQSDSSLSYVVEGVDARRQSSYALEYGELNGGYQRQKRNYIPVLQALYGAGTRADFASNLLISMLGDEGLSSSLRMHAGFLLIQMDPILRDIVFERYARSQFRELREAAFVFGLYTGY